MQNPDSKLENLPKVRI